MTLTPIQIRFGDVDMLGHVNNAQVHHFFDLGKTDYFRTVLGIREMRTGRGLILARTQTDFFAQTRFEEPVAVQTRVCKIGSKSLTLEHKLVNTVTGEIKAACEAVLVAFDFPGNVSVEIPVDWKTAIRTHEENV